VTKQKPDEELENEEPKAVDARVEGHTAVEKSTKHKTKAKERKAEEKVVRDSHRLPLASPRS